MTQKTILIDGEWNLKRNFEKRANMFSYGEHCGGSFGFLDSLRSVLNKTFPDRAIVFWDGVLAGKARHDIYPSYKGNRDKSWVDDSYRMTQEEIDREYEKNKYSKLQQKIKVKNYLEELFVRQTEVDQIEADDLIAHYCHTKPESEEIIIYSADKDYYQLISDKISLLRPSDNLIINVDNFKTIYGYNHNNGAILKCFEGDKSDNVTGIEGVGLKSILKYFPAFKDEVYDIERFIDESIELYKTKKLKIFEKIIGSRRVYNINNKILNLKYPMLNETAIEEIDIMHNAILIEDDLKTNRNIMNAYSMLSKDGFGQFIFNGDLELFFRPFYLLVTKEKEFAKSVLKG